MSSTAEKCKASTTIPAFDRPASPTMVAGTHEVAHLHPRRKLEIDCQAEVRGEITQPAEVFSRSMPVGDREAGR